jgi:hypothetical protein
MAAKAGLLQVKKYRYGLDMGGFWRCDKFLKIAVIKTGAWSLKMLRA